VYYEGTKVPSKVLSYFRTKVRVQYTYVYVYTLFSVEKSRETCLKKRRGSSLTLTLLTVHRRAARKNPFVGRTGRVVVSPSRVWIRNDAPYLPSPRRREHDALTGQRTSVPAKRLRLASPGRRNNSHPCMLGAVTAYPA
jgi:hypothetical protein